MGVLERVAPPVVVRGRKEGRVTALEEPRKTTAGPGKRTIPANQISPFEFFFVISQN